MDLPRQDPLELTRLIGVLAGMGIIWVMGLLDDRYKLRPRLQFAGMLLAAIVAILCKVFIEVFNSPFSGAQIKVDWYLMVPITLAWLIGMTETVNMLDGVDGLATGVTAIASLVLFVHMLRLGQYSVALLPLALLGVCLGFLRYNFYPARIFLGGGAYVLGFALGALAIVAGAKVATALLVLWVPIVDVGWQVYSRWKRGQPISLGDRGHLQFRLQDMGWSAPRIAALYYGVTALLGAVALFSPSRTLKLAVLAGLAIAVLVGLYLLTRKMGDRTPTGT
ncbi:MAG: MraY family glycosyltransferase [Anaerolineales bacterium]